MSSRGACQCITWLVWNKLAASKTLLWRRQKNSWVSWSTGKSNNGSQHGQAFFYIKRLASFSINRQHHFCWKRIHFQVRALILISCVNMQIWWPRTHLSTCKNLCSGLDFSWNLYLFNIHRYVNNITDNNKLGHQNKPTRLKGGYLFHVHEWYNN